MIKAKNQKNLFSIFLKEKLIQQKVKAQSLLFALVICFIMFSLVSFYILINYYNNIELNRYRLLGIARINAISGLNYLKNINDVSFNKTVSLYNGLNDSVDISLKPWGLFKIAFAHSKIKDISYSKYVLLGNKITSTNFTALYLRNNHKPITIDGAALLAGDLFLPDPNIRYSNQAIITPGLERKIDINIKQSLDKLPEVSAEFMEIVESISEVDIKDIRIEYGTQMYDSLVVSFSDPTKIIYSFGNIVLDRVFLKGNIKICSNTIIDIGRESKLEDVILSAPIIRIANEFTGRIQCLATDSILIGENVKLNYPSVLCIANNNNSQVGKSIILNKGDSIYGDILIYNSNRDTKKNLMIVPERSYIYGRIYCNGAIDFHGSIVGSLYTDHLIFVSSVFHENYISNSSINRKGLSPHYISAIFMKSDRNLEIIKNLY
jgi:hypothetical protein